MPAWRFIASVFICGALATMALSSDEGGTSSARAPRVIMSNNGMEGLTEVQIQVHVAGSADWRRLVDLDEAKLKKKIEDLLKGVPGLTLVDERGSIRTPRILVIAVGHLIADPEGNKDTSASNLSVSLNQPVSVRRPLPSGKPIVATGMTWHRSLLITGLNDSMRARVDDKLAYLLGQFKDEYRKANPRENGRQPSTSGHETQESLQ